MIPSVASTPSPYLEKKYKYFTSLLDISHHTRVAEVARGTGGTRRKVWTRTKILSPNIRYFVAN